MNVFLVQVLGEDGPPGVMELTVLEEGEWVTECDHPAVPGELVGSFDDGYQSQSLFCSRCLITIGEATEVRFFPSKEEAWAFVRAEEG